jgi:hypothetical protein
MYLAESSGYAGHFLLRARFQILRDVLAFFGNDKKLSKVLFRIEQSPSQNIPCDDFAFNSVAVAQIPPSAFFGSSSRLSVDLSYLFM